MVKELRNKLLSQALLAISQLAFPCIIYPIITRALRAEGLGKVNFTDSIVNMFLIIASLGIPLYGVRQIAIHKNLPQKQSKIFSELFILQLVICLPAAAGVWLLGAFSEVDHDLLLTGMIALVGGSLSCEWYLLGNQSFFFVAIRSVLIKAVAAILIIVLVRSQADYILYYAILTGAAVLTMILNLSAIIKKTGFSFKNINPWQHLKKLNWLFACYVFASLFTVFDSLMLGWLSSDQVVGHYSFGYRLVRLSAMLIPTIGVVFVPRISSAHAASDHEDVQLQISTSQQIIWLFCLPLSMLFLVLAPEIVSVFGSSDFASSINVIRILSPIPILVSFSHLTGTQILIPIHKEKIYFLFLLAGSILIITLNAMLIATLQEKAAAISNVAGESIVAIGTLIFLSRSKTLRISKKYFLYCLLISLLIVPIAYGLREIQLNPLLVIIFTMLIFGVIYLIIQLKLLSDTPARNLFFLKKAD